MKKILLIAVIAVLAVACNKDQSTVKRLDGTWKANKWLVTDGAVSIDWLGTGFVTNAEFSFTSCKLKDDEWCPGSLTIVPVLGDPINDAFIYRVTEKGTVLETKDDLSSVTVNRIEIVEMTRKTLETKATDADGVVTEAKFDKQ